MAALAEIDKNYDIGLVEILNYNYGNNLTNLALFNTLKRMGISVLLIDAPVKDNLMVSYKVIDKFGLFLENPYNLDDVCEEYENRWEIIGLNDKCKMFLTGSDQLWRAAMFVEPTDYYTCLDWVYSDKYKASYSTSIGIEDYDGDKVKFSELIGRFQKISVREKSAVNVIENLTGLEVQHVVDPVFLLDEKEYERLAYKGCGIARSKDYICAYLLDRDEWKENIIVSLQKKSSCEEIVGLTDILAENIDDTRIDYSLKPHVEEWLYLIENSAMFVTDSFHGLCFSLIYNKNFLVVFDEKSFRGFERIRTLLTFLGLEKRIITINTPLEKVLEIVGENVDYSKVNLKLQKFIIDSRNWLQEVIGEGLRFEGHKMQYDAQMLADYKKKYDDEKLRYEKYRFNYHQFINKYGNENISFVGWCTGGCFYKNILNIRRISGIKYVCDNDKEKWGRELVKDVYCISPNDLYQMQNVIVLVMTDYEKVYTEISLQLEKMDIMFYLNMEEWSRMLDGR